MNIQFQIKYYRGEVFRVWCKETYCGSGHGSYLVQLLGSPYYPYYDCGMTDNVWAAQQFLKHARNVGWIFRDRLHPSVEQQFFGIGGQSYKMAEGKYLVDYVWKPNKNSKSFETFVKTGNVGRLIVLSERYILSLEEFEKEEKG